MTVLYDISPGCINYSLTIAVNTISSNSPRLSSWSLSDTDQNLTFSQTFTKFPDKTERAQRILTMFFRFKKVKLALVQILIFTC